MTLPAPMRTCMLLILAVLVAAACSNDNESSSSAERKPVPTPPTTQAAAANHDRDRLFGECFTAYESSARRQELAEGLKEAQIAKDVCERFHHLFPNTERRPALVAMLAKLDRRIEYFTDLDAVVIAALNGNFQEARTRLSSLRHSSNPAEDFANFSAFIDAEERDLVARSASQKTYLPWTLSVEGYQYGGCSITDLARTFDEAKQWMRASSGWLELHAIREGPTSISFEYYDGLLKKNSVRTFYQDIAACERRVQQQQNAARSNRELIAGSAAEAADVEPSRLMLQHMRYVGQEVRFSIRSFGSLSNHPQAQAYLYIDDHPNLQPLFNERMVDKWISEGFDNTRRQDIVITGRVRPTKFGTNVLVDVTDIKRTK